jgi:hypothetical protein
MALSGDVRVSIRMLVDCCYRHTAPAVRLAQTVVLYSRGPTTAAAVTMGSRVVAYQTGARPSPGDYRGGPFRMVGERGP